MSERPKVTVSAQTANTTGISISTDVGDAWIVAGPNQLTIKANGLIVEVTP